MTAMLDGSLSRALASGNPWRLLDLLAGMGFEPPERGKALHALTTSCPDWHSRHERWVQERELDLWTELLLEMPDA